MKNHQHYTPRGKSFPELLNPLAVFRQLRALFPVTRMFARKDFKAQHAGTIMGVLWLVIAPIIMLSIYTFIFSRVFQARWETLPGDQNIYTFSLLLFAGIIPYQYFAEVTGRATSIMRDNINYIKKVKFPLEILPLGLGISHLTGFLVSTVILLAGVLLFMNKIAWTVIFLPVVFLPLFLFATGVGWLVAIACVYLKDVAKAWMIFLNLLFFLTPIFYPLERLPGYLRTVVRLNPMTVMIENFRAVMVIGVMPDWTWFWISSIMGVVIFIVGNAVFLRAKRGLCDVV